MKEVDFDPAFDKADTNKDGYLTKAEVAKSDKFSVIAENFDAIDTLETSADGTKRISRQALKDALNEVGILKK